jgi:putative hydrolase of HD superfamily
MDSVLELMSFAMRIKDLPRSGWNMEFPPGHRCMTRKVEKPESVGAHTFGLAFLAMLLTDEAKLNKLRVIEPGDYVTATEDDPEIRYQLRIKKQLAEKEALNQIVHAVGGELGEKIQGLSEEYDAGETAEAKFAIQLDKIEPCLQA